MASENEKVYGDPVKVGGLLQEFFEWYRLYITDAGMVVDKVTEFHKQISSFHERLLLVALGTVGISVSALISLVPKIPTTPATKLTFVFCVAPAWILLLISALTSRNVMAYTLRINRALLEDWSKRVDGYHVQRVVQSLTKLANAVSGTVNVGSNAQDVSASLLEARKNVQEAMEKQKDISLPSFISFDANHMKWQSKIAVWAMQLALVLLCVAAIRLFLLA